MLEVVDKGEPLVQRVVEDAQPWPCHLLQLLELSRKVCHSRLMLCYVRHLHLLPRRLKLNLKILPEVSEPFIQVQNPHHLLHAFPVICPAFHHSFLLFFGYIIGVSLLQWRNPFFLDIWHWV